MIDMDAALYVEYDNGSWEPLALIEAAIDIGQDKKVSVVTKNLARRCLPMMPAYTLLYEISGNPNPASLDALDIERFRVRRIWPEPETEWEILSPQEWAERLIKLREWSARQHFMIARSGDRLLVSDLGSTLGTMVNGWAIGHHFMKDAEPLHRGENHVVAGGKDSPFKFSIFIS